MGRPRIPLRDDAFSELTPEARYWIGFLMADGTIFDRGPSRQDQVKLAMLSEDHAHLEQFRAFVGYEGRIKTYTSNHGKSVSELLLTSQPIVDQLAQHGVIPHKTHTACAIGLEFDADFWRGVIDGDGWIADATRQKALELVGSHALMTQFSNYMKRLMPDAPAPTVDTHRTIFRVRMSHIRLMTLLPRLYYDGCVALPRKLERARAIVSIPLQRPARRY